MANITYRAPQTPEEHALVNAYLHEVLVLRALGMAPSYSALPPRMDYQRFCKQHRRARMAAEVRVTMLETYLTHALPVTPE